MPRPILPEVMKARAGAPTSDLLALLWAKKLQGYSITTITGVPPLRFRSDGSPLISWSMLGNGQQTGTPSPDNIIMPDFCGKLVGTDWAIPITSAGQTVPVYLGEVPTVRRIGKYEFTGGESFRLASTGYFYAQNIFTNYNSSLYGVVATLFSHYEAVANSGNGNSLANNQACLYAYSQTVNPYKEVYIKDTRFATANEFISYLATQYANGTPVTVWYALANAETGIVNEPLCKIGTYADELHSEDAGVTIPTAKGENTLTVESELQPSEMAITGYIKQA